MLNSVQFYLNLCIKSGRHFLRAFHPGTQQVIHKNDVFDEREAITGRDEQSRSHLLVVPHRGEDRHSPDREFLEECLEHRDRIHGVAPFYLSIAAFSACRVKRSQRCMGTRHSWSSPSPTPFPQRGPRPGRAQPPKLQAGAARPRHIGGKWDPCMDRCALLRMIIHAGDLLLSFWIFLSAMFIIFFTFFGVRPFLLWISSQKPEGRAIDEEVYISGILLRALAMAVITDSIGMFLAGAFILGIATPNGPSLAATLVDKSEVLITEFLMPPFTSLWAFKQTPLK